MFSKRFNICVKPWKVGKNIRKHAARGYLIFTQCPFDMEKDKLDHFRGNEIIPVTRKQSELFVIQNTATIAKKHLNTIMINNKL